MNTPIYRPRHKDIAQQMTDEMLYIANHSQESPLHLIGHLYLFLDYLAKSNSSPIQTQGNRMRDFYIKKPSLSLSRISRMISQWRTLPLSVI